MSCLSTKAIVLFALAVGGSCISGTTPACATEPGYSASVYVDFNSGPPIIAQSPSYMATPQTFSAMGLLYSVQATANDFRGGTVAVSASVTKAGTAYPLSASASADLTYSFSLDGPDGDLVPVLVTAEGTGGGTGYSSVGDALEIYNLTGFGGYVGLSGTFNYQDTIYFPVNTLFYLREIANVSVSTPGDVGESSTGFAQVDPTFTIDPAYADRYHFEGLPASAIGNVSSVPEPATWLLMIAGFGLVGTSMRRRHRLLRTVLPHR